MTPPEERAAAVFMYAAFSIGISGLSLMALGVGMWLFRWGLGL